MGAAPSTPSTVEHVTCPFCGLLCDDLTIEPGADALRVTARGCERARLAFMRRAATLEPQVDGRPCSARAAIGAAAELLRAARSPMFSGLATDVGGMRAVLALADRVGGIVDHAEGASAGINLRLLQDRGWVTTTLSEVRNHADLIVLLGTPVTDIQPRFFERVFPAETLVTMPSRTVVALAPGGPMRRSQLPAGVTLKSIPAPAAALGAIAMTLRALLAGRPVASPAVAGLKRTALAQLATRIRNARYTVIAWDSGRLPPAQAGALLEPWCDLVRELNATQRAAGLPLGGGADATTAGQVAVWQSGVPLPVRFTRGHPEHEPTRYQLRQALANGEADALVWISALGITQPVPETPLPTIVIADAMPERPPHVFLPVGTAGVDHAGALFRFDGVVALPLRQLRPSVLPSAGATLAAIEQAL